MTNEEIQSVPVPQHGRHNRWRLDSVHNPKWSSREKLRELRDVDNRFTFHRSLPMKSDYKIEISPVEQKIFDFLLKVNNERKLETTMRVAGGWIRNKLFDMECDDIDIALDNTLGKDFAENIAEYAKEKGMAFKAVGVIEARPDQSKHLETATTHIYGQAIDFVNLRCEEYANQDSRIPSSMRLGTPLEDALRRDLTINSLFYNVNTGTIEDFTGMGMNDMQNGIIQTPLPPRSTFLDDPLRVIRTVRFAATFNFLIIDDIIESAQLLEVREALQSKISRERVRTEIHKIMKGTDPVGAMSLLSEMKVANVIWTTCNGVKISEFAKQPAKKIKHDRLLYNDPQGLNWDRLQWNNSMFRMRYLYKQAKELHLDSETQALLMYAGLLTSCIGDRGDLEELIDNIMQVGMRQPQNVSNNLCTIAKGARSIKNFLEMYDPSVKELTFSEQVDFYLQRIQGDMRLLVGNWIRKDVKNLYLEACLLSNVIDTVGNEVDDLENEIMFGGLESRGRALAEAIRVADHGKMVEQMVNMRTVLNGNVIASFLRIKPGKSMSFIVNEMLDWQVGNTEDLRNEQNAQLWLEENKDRFLALHERIDYR
ncbi:CCA tRNA nucleotidyltransferase, mitochondrial [Acrasis kona]|uniref:CCA tRNA nucleotidyltransferase, mitochondrial n=1 Tax=Acrasis kona TaxID=1008807 RepID=A0AAW2ZRD9_9EUKA